MVDSGSDVDGDRPRAGSPAAADKFVTPCELPTPYEREILTILIEEAAEVQQRATKLLRFGRDEVQPGQTLTNRYRLSQEIGDFYAMVELAEHEGLIDNSAVFAGEQRKYERLKKYLQNSVPGGSSREVLASKASTQTPSIQSVTANKE